MNVPFKSSKATWHTCFDTSKISDMEFFDKVKAPTLGVLDVDDDTGIKRQVAVKKIHFNNRIIKDHSP